ncbi:MAG: hypothetical protein IKS41_04870 [Alphaproteobacteria bacterium]|nr:hypothetical protein [Alphaproteobacteria bacterium]
MKSFKLCLGALMVAGVCAVALPAGASYLTSCPEEITSVYEIAFPDLFLMEEAIVTAFQQQSLASDEHDYTKALGKRKGNYLKPVPGVGKKYKKHNEIIVQMQEAAGNGANIIQKSETSINGISNLGNYSSAKSQIQNKLTVRPYSERNGKTYTTAELNEILENQRTAINDLSANAIGMGAAETVNAACDAADSTPKDRAKQVAKAETLAELYELMLGMDRRIYERSLHVSAVEATNAGIEALRIMTGASTTSSAQ